MSLWLDMLEDWSLSFCLDILDNSASFWLDILECLSLSLHRHFGNPEYWMLSFLWHIEGLEPPSQRPWMLHNAFPWSKKWEFIRSPTPCNPFSFSISISPTISSSHPHWPANCRQQPPPSSSPHSSIQLFSSWWLVWSPRQTPQHLYLDVDIFLSLWDWSLAPIRDHSPCSCYCKCYLSLSVSIEPSYSLPLGFSASTSLNFPSFSPAAFSSSTISSAASYTSTIAWVGFLLTDLLDSGLTWPRDSGSLTDKTARDSGTDTAGTSLCLDMVKTQRTGASLCLDILGTKRTGASFCLDKLEARSRGTSLCLDMLDA